MICKVKWCLEHISAYCINITSLAAARLDTIFSEAEENPETQYVVRFPQLGICVI